LGNQSSAEVQNAMMCHHLFLLSSADEALPTVLLEAQAAGMVVLATDVGSVSTVVKSGQVVPADSIAAFSSALLKLIDQNALWDEDSKTGQDYIARHYDVNEQVKSLIDLYELNLYGSSIKKR
jgi:glycosyltransferase involved in cell wall biosynthesis